ncbi:MAG: FAD-dependent oxidoreductase [Snowella sp.]|nr:FAD-dependent oxidoreductase [Snowella sp.]
MVTQLTTDLLIVGGGTGGTAAAIQAARRGVSTILVSEFEWLGGMLTVAGVAAPDGNELAAWQTGFWGAYLKALQQKQSGGLDHSWVSLFTYDPRIGAEIFANWVKELPNLNWISGQIPLEVMRQGDRILGVRFQDYQITAKITLDGTELGDLLALGEIPHRWGWEWQEEFGEPSAPESANSITEKYPVQSPTWVFIAQDYGNQPAPPLTPLPSYDPSCFEGTWKNYGVETFLNYGRLPNNQFMINWPIAGNDYGVNINRILGSQEEKHAFLQEAYEHSYNFAYFLQQETGKNIGLAENIFPQQAPYHSAFALHPYYRESRRLKGKVTIIEQDILPQSGGLVAPLPMGKDQVSAIAIGNYANDHHYPGFDFPLAPKSRRWGGRWTGTPFTIPYHALVPEQVEGFLVCEKNISVSHIANGSTRLQPVVMNIGQAAGMAAALCIELNCQPQDLPVRTLQEALLTDPLAPSGIIPCYNLPPDHPDWLTWQRYYLDHPQDYPLAGNCPCSAMDYQPRYTKLFTGTFEKIGDQDYHFYADYLTLKNGNTWQLITERPEVNEQLLTLKNQQKISVLGRLNLQGEWILVDKIVEI